MLNPASRPMPTNKRSVCFSKTGSIGPRMLRYRRAIVEFHPAPALRRDNEFPLPWTGDSRQYTFFQKMYQRFQSFGTGM